LMPKLFAGSTLTGLVTAALTGAVAAQTSPPDFSSNQVGWLTFRLEYQKGPGGPTPLRNDPAHPRLGNLDAAKNGGQPTYFVADLNHPNLKPWVVERMKKDNAEVIAGKIAFTPHSSCMPAGVTGFHLYGFQPTYFIQTPKEVVMMFSGDQQVRHVYLDVPHSPAPKPSWYGESVGRYEGDTLVIDTVALNDKTFVDLFRTPHTDKLHVVERLRLIDDGKVLEAKITADDTGAFNEPWSWVQHYDRVREPMREQVCAENNQHLFDYHIPEAAKPDF
jgi:hypothetical protein